MASTLGFFLLGLLAGLFRSDLRIPKSSYDTFTIFLLLAIGIKGGMALSENLSADLLLQAVVIMALGFLIPILLMPVLQRWVGLSRINSAVLAAHYGSVSAGTFAVAVSLAEQWGLDYEAHFTVFLVVLEMPAIAVGIWLARRHTQGGLALGKLAHEVFASKGMVLLGGGLILGWIAGPDQLKPIKLLFIDAFPCWLALFLLEMGLCAAEYLRQFQLRMWRLAAFAIVTPLVLASVALGVGIALGMPPGSMLLLCALLASASYIAAPAAMRVAVPEADIGLAMTAALALTFPFNVLVGLPLYHQLIVWFGG